MKHTQNCQNPRLSLVDQNVMRSDHHFPGAFDPSWFVHVRIATSPFSCRFKLIILAYCRLRVILADIVHDIFPVHQGHWFYSRRIALHYVGHSFGQQSVVWLPQQTRPLEEHQWLPEPVPRTTHRMRRLHASVLAPPTCPTGCYDSDLSDCSWKHQCTNCTIPTSFK